MVMRFELADHMRLWRGLEANNEHFTADVFTNLVYMPALEDGHSKQAPHGMVDINLATIGREFDRSVSHAAAEVANGGDPDRALLKAINTTALFALREIVVDTPIDTGRARASWQVKLADGQEHDSVELGLTAPAHSRAARSARKRAEAGKRGVKRKFKLEVD